MNEQEILNKAQKAKNLLDDATLIEVFDDLREAIFKSIDECPIRDTEGLLHLRLMLKLLKDLRANLEQRVQAGNLVKVRIEEGTPHSNFLGGKSWRTNRANSR